jgi:adenine-specific DNA-methyltransferase
MVIKYLGSKRALVPRIERIVRGLPVASACDLFAGTTRVAQALRRLGLYVVANDLASYSEAFGQAYVERAEQGRVPELLELLRAAEPRYGYITETFCETARYFRPENGMRIDGIRAALEELDLELDPVERGTVLTALLEAADRVDSTVGVQMAYLKEWAPRARQPLDLREPPVCPGPPGEVTRLDANELAHGLGDVDLAYLDPPYNQHSYYSNYHVWETIVRGDEPAHYGTACKRLDCRTTKSRYNSRREAWAAFEELIGTLKTPWLLVSFSDEGFHDPASLRALLAERGYVGIAEVDSKRYVGAQIGIHNPQGEKVGTVGRLRNRELLFVVGPDRSAVESALS